MIGTRDLRAFCRPPMGVPGGVRGCLHVPGRWLADRAGSSTGQSPSSSGTRTLPASCPELRSSACPATRSSPMPDDGDVVTVTDEGREARTYTTSSPPRAEGRRRLRWSTPSIRPVVVTYAGERRANGQSIKPPMCSTRSSPPSVATRINVFRCRFRPFNPGELPADNVLPDADRAGRL